MPQPNLSIFAEIDKILGKDFLAHSQADVLEHVRWYMPSGSVLLDWVLGKGWPMNGKLIELKAPENQWKTTMGMMAIKQAQLSGGAGLYLTSEHTLDLDHIARLGVKCSDKDFKEERWSRGVVGTAQEAFIAMDAAIRGYIAKYPREYTEGKKKIVISPDQPTGPPFVILLDSMGALAGEELPMEKLEKRQPASEARYISAALRGDFLNQMAGYNILLLYTNHLYERMNVMFGNNLTTSGGRKLKYLTDVSLETKHKEPDKSTRGHTIGGQMEISIPRSKLSIPHRKVSLSILYDGGLNEARTIWRFLEAKKVLYASEGKRGKSILTLGEESFSNQYQFFSTFEESGAFRNKVLKLVTQILEESPGLDSAWRPE